MHANRYRQLYFFTGRKKVGPSIQSRSEHSDVFSVFCSFILQQDAFIRIGSGFENFSGWDRAGNLFRRPAPNVDLEKTLKFEYRVKSLELFLIPHSKRKILGARIKTIPISTKNRSWKKFLHNKVLEYICSSDVKTFCRTKVHVLDFENFSVTFFPFFESFDTFSPQMKNFVFKVDKPT